MTLHPPTFRRRSPKLLQPRQFQPSQSNQHHHMYYHLTRDPRSRHFQLNHNPLPTSSIELSLEQVVEVAGMEVMTEVVVTTIGNMKREVGMRRSRRRGRSMDCRLEEVEAVEAEVVEVVAAAVVILTRCRQGALRFFL